MSVGTVLNAIPDGLRVPLLAEYQSIIQNYSEHRWGPLELSGGKFCEIVYNILDGQAKNAYIAAPSKPGGDVALQSVDLALDVPQTVDGMELLWTGVEDSRCPADVTCVWAGQVTVHIRVTDGGDARPLELTLGAGGDAVDSERHRLRLTAVSPYPRSTGAVERGQQRATIEIARK